MKASTALRKAQEHIDKAGDLMRPISDHFAKILGDDCAHVTHNPGDGMLIVSDEGMASSKIRLSTIDSLVKMDHDELRRELARTRV